MASQILSIDGFAVRVWKNSHGSKNPPRGYLWINHGLGEHSGRYHSLAEFMSSFGWDVIAPDLPGHGLTKAKGLHVQLIAPDETIPFLNLLVQKLARHAEIGDGSTFIKSPKILMGHSMGALISALWLCAEQPPADGFEWKASFLSAPAIRLKLKVPNWKLGLAKVLAQVAPNFKIGNEISNSDLSVDIANRAEYASDPMVHRKASPRLFWGLRRGSGEVMAKSQMIEIPVCLAVAKNDPVVDSSSVREFFDRINTHKKFLEFPLSKHDIFNDVEKKLVYESLLKWCAQ